RYTSSSQTNSPLCGYVCGLDGRAVDRVSSVSSDPNQLGRLVASLQAVQAGQSGGPAAQAAIFGAALLALHGVASLVYTFLAAFVSERIVNDLRGKFFSSLVNQRLDQHPPKALGQIANEFASDLSLIQDGLS